MDDRDDDVGSDPRLTAGGATRRGMIAASAAALFAALGAAMTEARQRRKGKHRTRNNNRSDATSIGQGGPGGAGGAGGNVCIPECDD
ncbi:MAG: hypothetical protein ACRDJC_00340 [Thermomicrobiales bacterium]